MPRFFFNYTSGGTFFVDDMGAEFPSLEAAYLDTCKGALAIAFEKLRARQDPNADVFEITDDKRNVLMHVPFSEVLRPSVAKSFALRGHQTVAALENCCRQIARGQQLKDELRKEIAKTRKMFDAIRANLLTSHTV
jgi:hypothetical protein